MYAHRLSGIVSLQPQELKSLENLAKQHGSGSQGGVDDDDEVTSLSGPEYQPRQPEGRERSPNKDRPGIDKEGPVKSKDPKNKTAPAVRGKRVPPPRPQIPCANKRKKSGVIQGSKVWAGATKDIKLSVIKVRKISADNAKEAKQVASKYTKKLRVSKRVKSSMRKNEATEKKQQPSREQKIIPSASPSPQSQMMRTPPPRPKALPANRAIDSPEGSASPVPVARHVAVKKPVPIYPNKNRPLPPRPAPPNLPKSHPYLSDVTPASTPSKKRPAPTPPVPREMSPVASSTPRKKPAPAPPHKSLDVPLQEENPYAELEMAYLSHQSEQKRLHAARRRKSPAPDVPSPPDEDAPLPPEDSIQGSESPTPPHSPPPVVSPVNKQRENSTETHCKDSGLTDSLSDDADMSHHDIFTMSNSTNDQDEDTYEIVRIRNGGRKNCASYKKTCADAEYQINQDCDILEDTQSEDDTHLSRHRSLSPEIFVDAFHHGKKRTVAKSISDMEVSYRGSSPATQRILDAEDERMIHQSLDSLQQALDSAGSPRNTSMKKAMLSMGCRLIHNTPLKHILPESIKKKHIHYPKKIDGHFSESEMGYEEKIDEVQFGLGVVKTLPRRLKSYSTRRRELLEEVPIDSPEYGKESSFFDKDISYYSRQNELFDEEYGLESPELPPIEEPQELEDNADEKDSFKQEYGDGKSYPEHDQLMQVVGERRNAVTDYKDLSLGKLDPKSVPPRKSRPYKRSLMNANFEQQSSYSPDIMLNVTADDKWLSVYPTPVQIASAPSSPSHGLDDPCEVRPRAFSVFTPIDLSGNHLTLPEASASRRTSACSRSSRLSPLDGEHRDSRSASLFGNVDLTEPGFERHPSQGSVTIWEDGYERKLSAAQYVSPGYNHPLMGMESSISGAPACQPCQCPCHRSANCCHDDSSPSTRSRDAVQSFELPSLKSDEKVTASRTSPTIPTSREHSPTFFKEDHAPYHKPLIFSEKHFDVEINEIKSPSDEDEDDMELPDNLDFAEEEDKPKLTKLVMGRHVADDNWHFKPVTQLPSLPASRKQSIALDAPRIENEFPEDVQYPEGNQEKNNNPDCENNTEGIVSVPEAGTSFNIKYNLMSEAPEGSVPPKRLVDENLKKTEQQRKSHFPLNEKIESGHTNKKVANIATADNKQRLTTHLTNFFNSPLTPNINIVEPTPPVSPHQGQCSPASSKSHSGRSSLGNCPPQELAAASTGKVPSSPTPMQPTPLMRYLRTCSLQDSPNASENIDGELDFEYDRRISVARSSISGGSGMDSGRSSLVELPPICIKPVPDGSVVLLSPPVSLATVEGDGRCVCSQDPMSLSEPLANAEMEDMSVHSLDPSEQSVAVSNVTRTIKEEVSKLKVQTFPVKSGNEDSVPKKAVQGYTAETDNLPIIVDREFDSPEINICELECNDAIMKDGEDIFVKQGKGSISNIESLPVFDIEPSSHKMSKTGRGSAPNADLMPHFNIETPSRRCSTGSYDVTVDEPLSVSARPSISVEPASRRCSTSSYDVTVDEPLSVSARPSISVEPASRRSSATVSLPSTSSLLSAYAPSDADRRRSSAFTLNKAQGLPCDIRERVSRLNIEYFPLNTDISNNISSFNADGEADPGPNPQFQMSLPYDNGMEPEYGLSLIPSIPTRTRRGSMHPKAIAARVNQASADDSYPICPTPGNGSGKPHHLMAHTEPFRDRHSSCYALYHAMDLPSKLRLEVGQLRVQVFPLNKDLLGDTKESGVSENEVSRLDAEENKPENCDALGNETMQPVVDSEEGHECHLRNSEIPDSREQEHVDSAGNAYKTLLKTKEVLEGKAQEAIDAKERSPQGHVDETLYVSERLEVCRKNSNEGHGQTCLEGQQEASSEDQGENCLESPQVAMCESGVQTCSEGQIEMVSERYLGGKHEATSEGEGLTGAEGHQKSASEIEGLTCVEGHRKSTSEGEGLTSAEGHRKSTSKVEGVTGVEGHRKSTSEGEGLTGVEGHRKSTSKGEGLTGVEGHRKSTSKGEGLTGVEGHRKSTSEGEGLTGVEGHRKSTSEGEGLTGVEGHRKSTSEGEGLTGVEGHRKSTSKGEGLTGLEGHRKSTSKGEGLTGLEGHRKSTSESQEQRCHWKSTSEGQGQEYVEGRKESTSEGQGQKYVEGRKESTNESQVQEGVEGHQKASSERRLQPFDTTNREIEGKWNLWKSCSKLWWIFYFIALLSCL